MPDFFLVYRYDPGWTKMPGKLKMISVGSRSRVWGINDAENVFHWTTGLWVQKPGNLKSVSVAADGTVWGATAAPTSTNGMEANG